YSFAPDAKHNITRTTLQIRERTFRLGTICIGFVVLICQIIGGVKYPLGWDTEGNRRFVETLDRSASVLSSGQSVGDRLLPERIIERWRQPWNYLSNLGPILPRPLRTESWDRATHYMDDQGNLRAFADAPRQEFKNADGSDLFLSMVPPFEYVGFFESAPSRRVDGWFNPLLAPRDKVRIAIVGHHRIMAWAVEEDRPDVGAFFYGAKKMAPAGFTALLPPEISNDELSTVAVIDNRIGITLPLLVKVDNSQWLIQNARTTTGAPAAR
ncbi:MAG TPA: hypothetical protein VMU37_01915, partial [Caulobacteraceae bacterium]|nr:hypothetical protein [Caulobacteraceae bacterium]